MRVKKERVRPFCDGQDPLTVVEKAIAKRRSLMQEQAYSAEDGDQTWAVFDGEEHRLGSEEKLARWKRATELAAKENILIANSEPCVELWFLLHFQDQTASIGRKQAQAALKRHHPNYEKGDAQFFVVLKNNGSEADAKRRATQLRDRHKQNRNCERYTNPSTHLDQLVIAIQEIDKNC